MEVRNKRTNSVSHQSAHNKGRLFGWLGEIGWQLKTRVGTSALELKRLVSGREWKNLSHMCV